MKKSKNIIAVALSGVMLCGVVSVGLAGCGTEDNYYADSPQELNRIVNEVSLLFMGNDAYSWNVLSVDPQGSFGFEGVKDTSWYSFSPTTKDELDQNREILQAYASELDRVRLSDLSGADIAKYNVLKYNLDTQTTYYSSPYAADFVLIGGPYISAEGGYVASFADVVENYAFRNENDVSDLLGLTRSTAAAFVSYLDYAAARSRAGYPLYDYTIDKMCEYLESVYSQGEEYYLYEFIDGKLDDAEFLSEVSRQTYKSQFDEALTNNFMRGVNALASGLPQYKGRVSSVDKGYLAAYGEAGRAYYQYLFQTKTGLKDVNISQKYFELISEYLLQAREQEGFTARIEELKTSDPALYNNYRAYLDGEKLLLDLVDPEEMLVYLKSAAKYIVPDLANEPTIDIKYMDETVAPISTNMAYYLLSPVDEINSVERITLNPEYCTGGEPGLLTTIAHEGYPGHLYAHVKSKEQGTLTLLNGCLGFAEGWAKYVEHILLDTIAAQTDDTAVKLYCEYKKAEDYMGFLNMVLFDIQVNYFGYGVTELIESGFDESDAVEVVSALMEIPGVYIPYGYGAFVMHRVHDSAKSALGEKYDEVAFNGAILSEGEVTLDRLEILASNYVASVK